MFQGLIWWLIAVLRGQHSKPALVIQLLTLVVPVWGPLRASRPISRGPGVQAAVIPNENH